MKTKHMQVPVFDLKRQAEGLKPELMAAVERVLMSGRYILGAEVEAFEQEMGAYLGVNHAIGVASGTDALWLSLKALGIGPGDKVLTTPLTFFATASAILNTGAEPVFADIDPSTFNLDPDQVQEALQGRSSVYRRLDLRSETIKAMMPVHLFGQSADIDALASLAQEHGDLPIVEDAAQALGAQYGDRKVGSLGHLGCFSFFPTKNLGGFGDGGLVATNQEATAQQLRLLRAHGSRAKYHHELIGSNSRLDAMQAALLRVKLQHLDSWVASRRSLAAAYDEILEDMNGLQEPYQAPGRTHTYHQYTVRVQGGRRDELQEFLRLRGIGTSVYYPIPLHLQPALRSLGYKEGDFPQAEQACAEVLSLPMFPEMTADERSWTIQSIRSFRDAST